MGVLADSHGGAGEGGVRRGALESCTITNHDQTRQDTRLYDRVEPLRSTPYTRIGTYTWAVDGGGGLSRGGGGLGRWATVYTYTAVSSDTCICYTDYTQSLELDIPAQSAWKVGNAMLHNVLYTITTFYTIVQPIEPRVSLCVLRPQEDMPLSGTPNFPSFMFRLRLCQCPLCQMGQVEEQRDAKYDSETSRVPSHILSLLIFYRKRFRRIGVATV